MKEICCGLGIAFFIFLLFLGIDVFPLLLLLLLGGGAYFLILAPGKIKSVNSGPGTGIKNPLQFDQIGGQDVAIKELKEALQFILKPKEMDTMGIRPIKGVLLVGPPGTGKTLLARAAASYTSSAFVAVSGSEFIEMYAGVGAKRIRHLFEQARKKARMEKQKSAIIFVDELEILGAKRGQHSSHMEYDQTLNQLLVEMDGLHQDVEPRVLLIGATNRADMLDPALLRPGRFDRHVQVGLPDREGRKRILEIHCRNKPLAEDVLIEEIAKATFGFSGAHLESLANEAAILAMRENNPAIQMNHFIQAIDKVIMGEKLDRKPSVQEMNRISVHESGHALVSELMSPGSVASLTIIPRGKALGFMRKSQDDQYLYTGEELEKQLMVTLAGAIAEEISLGSRSTGAKNDFQQAWTIAGELVESGLSSLGVVNGEKLPLEAFYQECKNIINRLEEKTQELLQGNIEILLNLSNKILEEEQLDRQAFCEIFNSISCTDSSQGFQGGTAFEGTVG